MLSRIRFRLGRKKAKAIRSVRRILPYPRIWARLTGANVPAYFIANRYSGINRPEGVTFSRLGDLMSISNADDRSISFYARSDSGETLFNRQPCLVISDPDRLHFVHDIAFSPNQDLLAAVGRDGHWLTMYALQGDINTAIKSERLYAFQGERFGLNYPAGVAFHPSGEWLAVANRLQTGITLYPTRSLDSQFNLTLHQSIDEEAFASWGLESPHGLEFSPSGEFLIVVHKSFFKKQGPIGDSAITLFRWRRTPEPGLDPSPVAVVRCDNIGLHSVAMHPSGETVAVSNEDADILIFKWQDEQQALTRTGSIRVFRAGKGPKGVAFTKDGKHLAVTTELNEVLFFDLDSGV